MRSRPAATALAFALLCAAAPAADRPVIQSDKARPAEGSTIRVVGNGFVAHERAQVLIDPPRSKAVVLGSAKVSSLGGAFEERVRLPKGLKGAAVLLGCQQDCRIRAAQRLKILPAR